MYDETLHPTDCWLEMEKLVAKGLVKSIGLSNFNSEQIEDVLKKGTIKPVTNQVDRLKSVEFSLSFEYFISS